MLDYFQNKKTKKHQADGQVKSPSPVLSPTDEQFLERIVEAASETPPPLPARPFLLETGNPAGNDQQLVLREPSPDDETSREAPVEVESPDTKEVKRKGKGKEKIKDTLHKKSNRWSFLQRSGTKKDKKHHDSKTPHVSEDGTITPNEAAKEKQDINSVLDSLNMSAVNNRAFSMSAESQVVIQKFTVVLKDLVNGVPTAYDDLVHLLDDSQDTLQKNYKHLPSYLQKFIKTLPEKLSTTLAPEMLATSAETAGMSAAEKGGVKHAAAKAGLRVPSLKDMVTKPGAVVGILKAIMNFLKLRWPAFLGTNVLLSLGLFVLLSFFWYCHKRGKEVRLAKEAARAGGSADADNDRFEELSSVSSLSDDDNDGPRAGAAGAGTSSAAANALPSSSSANAASADVPSVRR
ncbi:MAG: hypothetical protein M1817_005818 [Caeruleum heppii]|nr:MAG: hypothetical protein M1817_005818 [Caeruleum heppii]